MAGTVTLSYSMVEFQLGNQKKLVRKVSIDWVADASAATVPDTAVELYGYPYKVLTNPGAVAPTDNYDIKFLDPYDTALDAMGGALLDRDTANTEVVYPAIACSPGTVVARPPLLAGSYTFNLTNNAVNSATGNCTVWMVDSLT